MGIRPKHCQQESIWFVILESSHNDAFGSLISLFFHCYIVLLSFFYLYQKRWFAQFVSAAPQACHARCGCAGMFGMSTFQTLILCFPSPFGDGGFNLLVFGDDSKQSSAPQSLDWRCPSTDVVLNVKEWRIPAVVSQFRITNRMLGDHLPDQIGNFGGSVPSCSSI